MFLSVDSAFALIYLVVAPSKCLHFVPVFAHGDVSSAQSLPVSH